jgi:hypothetical protein
VNLDRRSVPKYKQFAISEAGLTQRQQDRVGRPNRGHWHRRPGSRTKKDGVLPTMAVNWTNVRLGAGVQARSGRSPRERCAKTPGKISANFLATSAKFPDGSQQPPARQPDEETLTGY